MPISSGQVVTADDLNHLKPTTYSARATADLVGVVVDTDIVGATIPVDTETDNAVYVVHGTFGADWGGAATAGNFVRGKLAVDGVTQTGEAQFEQATGASGDRIPGSQVWRGTLAVAGSHTLKLIGTVNDADQRILADHTALVIDIHEVV